MNWKTSVAWAVLFICLLGSTIGCNKPADGTKKSTGPAPTPGPAPANTTDSK